jgi:hypothetical protein
MVRSFTMTAAQVAAGPTRLSVVYGDGPGMPTAQKDIPYRQLILQGEGATLISGDPSVDPISGSLYGYSVPIAGQLVLGPFEAGPLKLSGIWASGTGPLHILGVPY